ncbi:MAG: hypothetical protein ACQ9MH_14210 [Nitrospinales bacterium]
MSDVKIFKPNECGKLELKRIIIVPDTGQHSFTPHRGRVKRQRTRAKKMGRP